MQGISTASLEGSKRMNGRRVKRGCVCQKPQRETEIASRWSSVEFRAGFLQLGSNVGGAKRPSVCSLLNLPSSLFPSPSFVHLMTYIPSYALPALRNYRYQGIDKCVACVISLEHIRVVAERATKRSFISSYVLNPFWTWFVTLWPRWIAPNMVRS